MPTGTDLITHMNDLTIIPNSLAIYGMGQMGVALKGPDGILYLDICLTDMVEDTINDPRWKRGYPPPVHPNEVTNATHFLSTHEHLDHLDPQTLAPASKASPNASFVVTGWSREIMAGIDVAEDRLIIPRANEPVTLPGTTARLTAIPAAHYDMEYSDENGYRWFGYFIEWNGVTFYHSGDTILFDGYFDLLDEMPTPDVAMLAVNGRDYYREIELGAIGNLLPVEAARLAHDRGWRTLIFGHNDMYPHNMLPFAELISALERVHPRQQYKVLQPGELYYFVR